MTSRRYKSGPFVRRQYLAFREFGEIERYITGYKQRIWHYEDGPPQEMFAPSLDLLEHHRQVLIYCDLDAYEAFARS